MFIVKTYLNSIFTNDLKRKENFSKNVQSYRVCSLKVDGGYMVIVNTDGDTGLRLIDILWVKMDGRSKLKVDGGSMP